MCLGMTPLQAYSQRLTGVQIQKLPPPCLNAGQTLWCHLHSRAPERTGGSHDPPKATFLLSFSCRYPTPPPSLPDTKTQGC